MMRRCSGICLGLALTFAANVVADTRRDYTLTVEWEGDKVAAFEIPFRAQLGRCSQIRIAPNEEERQRIITEIEANLSDLVNKDSRVEIGEMTGWDFTIVLLTYESPTTGDAKFAAKIHNIAGGEVDDIEVTMSLEGETVAAERLAYDVCRRLPPRAGVSRWTSTLYQTVMLDVGSNEGLEIGQKLIKTDGQRVVARLAVTKVWDMESEADIESGEVAEGDGLTVELPEIPRDKASTLRVIASQVGGEFAVWVDGVVRGKSNSGYVEIPVWPGRHHVRLTGAVIHEEQVVVGDSGYMLELKPKKALQVNSSVPGIVRARRVGSDDWRQLGNTGRSYDLAPGTYDVRVIGVGYVPWTKRVILTSDTKVLQAAPQPTTGMVKVPGGKFRVGHPVVTDQPQRDTVIADFLMDAREVTVTEFQASWATYVAPEGYPDDAPVIGVSWQQAYSYCESRGKRLPTEDEWERACRGPTGARYGYGEYYDPMASDARTSEYADDYPLKDMPPNDYGLFDMTGGVWEWCGTATDAHADQRVLRGGAWRMLDPAGRADCIRRLSISSDKEGTTPFGFRCAADAE